MRRWNVLRPRAARHCWRGYVRGNVRYGAKARGDPNTSLTTNAACQGWPSLTKAAIGSGRASRFDGGVGGLRRAPAGRCVRTPSPSNVSQSASSSPTSHSSSASCAQFGCTTVRPPIADGLTAEGTFCVGVAGAAIGAAVEAADGTAVGDAVGSAAGLACGPAVGTVAGTVVGRGSSEKSSRTGSAASSCERASLSLRSSSSISSTSGKTDSSPAAPPRRRPRKMPPTIEDKIYNEKSSPISSSMSMAHHLHGASPRTYATRTVRPVAADGPSSRQRPRGVPSVSSSDFLPASPMDRRISVSAIMLRIA